MKIGLVLEGGAFRGLFTAGVLDYLMERDIQFQYAVGVSAGAGNQLNFISHQEGRTKAVIQADEENAFFGPRQMRKSKKLLNLDRMFFEFPYNQYPYDFEKYENSEVEFEFVVTNCETGKAEYIKKCTNQMKMLTAAKASCSVPILCSPVEIDGNFYLDGSVADSIPVQRAIDAGCDKVFVILTRRIDETPTNYGKMRFIMRPYKKRYPELYEALMKRTEVYQRQIELLNKLENEGRVFIVRPEMQSISKFETDKSKLDEFYQHGYEIMSQKADELKMFMEE